MNVMTTVLHAAAAITPEGPIAPAEVRFTGDRIVYVGPPVTPAADAVQLPEHILMPGLVNAHTHSAMTLLRGVDDDNGFMPWLAEVQRREQFLTHDDVQVGLELAMLEMIASGTTTFADMYVWDAHLLERVRSAGMRVFAALALTHPEATMFPGVSERTGREELEHVRELAERFAGDPQIRVGYGPHAPYSVPEPFFREVIAEAQRHDLPVHTHVSESVAEVNEMRERTGRYPAEYLADLGIFDTDLLAAHCVYLEPGETALFAEHGAALSHNPVSNMKLGNGVAPLLDWLRAGVRVGIGTDSVASNNSLDLFEELKFGTLLQRGMHGDAAALSAARMLQLVTNGDAVGFPETGELAEGKLADIIAVRAAGGEANPVSHLTFASRGSDVSQVWIGGRHVFSDGEFLTLNAPDIRARARASAERLRVQANAEPR